MPSLKRWLDWRRWIVYVHRWLGIAGGVRRLGDRVDGAAELATGHLYAVRLRIG